MPSFLMTWPEPWLFLALALIGLGLGLLAGMLFKGPAPVRHQGRLVPAGVLLAGGCAVAAAGLAWVVLEVATRTDYCHYDLRLENRNGQCVGVSDGSYAFDRADNPALGRVTELIERENARAERSKSTVTVAFMLPMTPDDAPERRQVLSEVQGAYLAQRHANRSAPLGSRTPDIRLVLANPGRGYESWGTVSARLRGMADDARHPLRAVTGFNLSVAETERALHDLTDAHIPVVGGPITADEMENVRKDGKQRFPGMARTAPTNSAQARALVNFNKAAKPEDSVLVVDVRPGDSYNSSLAKAFAEAVSPRTKPKEFESRGPTVVGNVANQLSSVVDSICTSEAKNVYFAGRPAHLRLFLLELADRPCGTRQLKVITGSGASTVSLYLGGEDWQTLRRSRQVTLQYAAVGHPRMWQGSGFGKHRKFYTNARSSPSAVLDTVRAEAERLDSALGGSVRWEDSRIMSAFDSVWLAANALKEIPPGADEGAPSLEDVRSQWRATYSGQGVPGVTGWLCLDNDGNPYNKAVAVVTLDQSDRTVRFGGMGWPEGEASPDCEVPSSG